MKSALIRLLCIFLVSIGNVRRRALNKWTKRLDAVEVALLINFFRSNLLQPLYNGWKHPQDAAVVMMVVFVFTQIHFILWSLSELEVIPLFVCFNAIHTIGEIPSLNQIPFCNIVDLFCESPRVLFIHNEPYVCVLLSSLRLFTVVGTSVVCSRPTWSHSNKTTDGFSVRNMTS